MAAASPQEAMRPVQAALRERSHAAQNDVDDGAEEECEEPQPVPNDNGATRRERSKSSKRWISAIDAVGAAPAAAPRGAKEKAAEHVWSSAKRRAEGSWSTFAGKPCTDKASVLGKATLPCTRWLCPYDFRRNLKSDLIAGCTVGVMVIPQSISYASLAGLGPIYGLYSALLPAFICECMCFPCAAPGIQPLKARPDRWP
jgi:hypothetical protein